MGARLNRLFESFTLTPIPPLELTTDVAGLDGQHGARELRAQHVQPEMPAPPAAAPPFDAEPAPNSIVVGEHGRDGVDFSRMCFLHQWASLPGVSSALVHRTVCPHCAADADVEGRKRYRELVTRLVLVGR